MNDDNGSSDVQGGNANDAIRDDLDLFESIENEKEKKKTLLKKYENKIEFHRKSNFRVGEYLNYIYELKLYEIAGFSDFADYAWEKLKYKKTHAYNLMNGYKVYASMVGAIGAADMPDALSPLLPLYDLNRSRRLKVYRRALEYTRHGHPLAKTVVRALKELYPEHAPKESINFRANISPMKYVEKLREAIKGMGNDDADRDALIEALQEILGRLTQAKNSDQPVKDAPNAEEGDGKLPDGRDE